MSTDPTCPTCELPLLVGQKYCSKTCYDARSKGPKMTKAQCAECGTPFTHPAKRLKIYCSNPCRIVATARLNKGRCRKTLHQQTAGRGSRTAFEPL